MKSKCELCGIECELTRHHLIPQVTSRSNKYPKTLKTDENNILMICGVCHSEIHAAYTNQELRDLYNTKENLERSDKISKYLKWRKKHPDFKGISKMSREQKLRNK